MRSPADMVKSFKNSELQSLLNKHKEYETIETLLHVLATTLNVYD